MHMEGGEGVDIGAAVGLKLKSCPYFRKLPRYGDGSVIGCSVSWGLILFDLS
jgi:hypothetical protein